MHENIRTMTTKTEGVGAGWRNRGPEWIWRTRSDKHSSEVHFGSGGDLAHYIEV